METMAGTGMDTQVLTILGAAFGVMFATLTTLLVTSIRFQHRDSLQTRELITQTRNETRELITQASNETRELITQASNDNRKLIEQATAKNPKLIEQATAKNSRLIEQATAKLTTAFDKQTSVTHGKLDKIVTSLSDARERLARIEGHLGIGLPSQTEPESNGDNSEAA